MISQTTSIELYSCNNWTDVDSESEDEIVPEVTTAYCSNDPYGKNACKLVSLSNKWTPACPLDSHGHYLLNHFYSLLIHSVKLFYIKTLS